MKSIDYQFIILGLSSFSSLPQREQGIAFELARRGSKVDFIEIPDSSIGFLRQKANALFQKSAIDITDKALELPELLNVHTPPHVLTSFRNSLVPGIDKQRFRSWFTSTFADQNWDRTILWVMFPLWWKWYLDTEYIQPLAVVYDIADDLEVFSSSAYSLKRFKESEELFAKEADAITYSAAEMEAGIKKRFPKTPAFLLPNAMSEQFRTLAESAPRKMNTNPVIGYVGSLRKKWIDTELILKTAKKYSENKIVIVGPMNEAFADKLRCYPNVEIHGFIGHEKIAQLLPTFDVALIPFKQNDITHVVNPLKLYEYAAAGLPIVAMRTYELERYSEYVYLSDSHEGFLANIRTAIGDSNPDIQQKRKLFALSNTWQGRLDIFEQVVDNTLFTR